MTSALFETSIKSLPFLSRGKVRDIYAVGADHLLIVGLSLWPRSRGLGPNLSRLPVAAVARGEVAFTIADGPDPQVTPEVLALLAEQQPSFLSLTAPGAAAFASAAFFWQQSALVQVLASPVHLASHFLASAVQQLFSPTAPAAATRRPTDASSAR